MPDICALFDNYFTCKIIHFLLRNNVRFRVALHIRDQYLLRVRDDRRQDPHEQGLREATVTD